MINCLFRRCCLSGFFLFWVLAANGLMLGHYLRRELLPAVFAGVINKRPAVRTLRADSAMKLHLLVGKVVAAEFAGNKPDAWMIKNLASRQFGAQLHGRNLCQIDGEWRTHKIAYFALKHLQNAYAAFCWN